MKILQIGRKIFVRNETRRTKLTSGKSASSSVKFLAERFGSICKIFIRFRYKHFFFPPLCLHCQNQTDKFSHLFCCGCLPFFELLAPKEYPTDWSKEYLVTVSAALPYLGPVPSLVKKLKFGQMPFLAKSAAAFLTAQFHRLGWPLPDYLVPMPRPFLRTIFYGINHAEMIAKKLAKDLELPLGSFLRRRSGDFPQSRLEAKQRQNIMRDSFHLRHSQKITDKTLLLIDDVLTTGTTMKYAVETLLAANPRKIYVLTLCRSDPKN